MTNQLTQLQAEIYTQIRDLEIYLSSDKFRCGHELDYYVNINDILPRLQQIRSAIQERIN